MSVILGKQVVQMPIYSGRGATKGGRAKLPRSQKDLRARMDLSG